MVINSAPQVFPTKILQYKVCTGDLPCVEELFRDKNQIRECHKTKMLSTFIFIRDKRLLDF